MTDSASLIPPSPDKNNDLKKTILETICQNTETCLVYLDRDFNFVWVNDAYARVCGRARSEFAGHNHFEFYPHEENKAIFRRVRDTGEPFKIEAKPFVFPDHPEWGTTYWDWTLTPDKDDEGKVQGLVFSLVDVTERKRAELALAGSEEQFRLSADAARIGTWQWDILNDDIVWDSRCLEMFGIPPGAKPSYSDFLNALHPDDRAKVDSAVALALEGRIEYEVEYRTVHSDGTIYWLLAKGGVVWDDSGKPVFMSGICVDVTERKYTEDAIESIALFPDENPSPVLRVSADGQLLYANPASTQLLKYWGCNAGDRVPEEIILIAQNTLESGAGTSYDLEYDGRCLEFVIAPMAEAGYVNLYGRDVTDRRNTERELLWHHTLASRTADIFLAVRTDGQIVDANDAAVRVYGYTREELLSINVKDLRPEEELAITDEQLERARNGLLFETVHKRKDGTIFPVEVNSIGVKLDDELILASVIRDISERRAAERALRQSEDRVRKKLNSIISPEGGIGDLELADILDIEAIQSIMDSFYKLAPIPMSIIDLKGEVLVGVGWQDICTRFHRANPETCAHCIESDTLLTADVPQGEFRLYKCKNNMWDVSTPLYVGGKHVGNIFSGQFLLDDEVPDYAFFREQARHYGFDENEYIAALDRVPRLSRNTVNEGMSFFIRLADMLSKLSYGNIELARLLAERKQAENELRKARAESEQNAAQLQSIFSSMADGVYLTDTEGRILFVNEAGTRILEIPEGEASEDWISRSRRYTLDGKVLPTEQIATVRAMRGETVKDCTYRILLPWGKEIVVGVSASPVRDAEGRIVGATTVFHDETEKVEFERRKEELFEREHRIAETLQNALVPPELPGELQGCRIGSVYESASDEAEVGGDFYDVFELGENRIGVLIGDIAGKGLQAAIGVASARYAIRAYAYSTLSPANVLTLANNALCREQSHGMGMLTAFFAVIDMKYRTLTYANAGHVSLVVVSADGMIEELHGVGLPLAVMGNYNYTEYVYNLRPHDILVAMTDGIIEAHTGPTQLFDKDGVINYLANGPRGTVQEIASGLISTAKAHAGGKLQDDAAVLVICPLPSEAESGKSTPPVDPGQDVCTVQATITGCESLTRSTAQDFVERLERLRVSCGSIQVDLRQAVFIDTSVLNALADTALAMLDQGQRLSVLVSEESYPLRVLQMIRFDEIIDVRAEPDTCPDENWILLEEQIIELRYKADDLERCRTAAFNTSRTLGFSIKESWDITAAFVEACANALEHGNKDSGLPVEVTLRALPDRFEARVKDHGKGFICPEESPIPPPTSRRGRGIPLMKLMMDEVTINCEDGCEVTLVKYLRDVNDKLRSQ